jgi:uncharacterized membrane protein YeaQ/YmgE (transglycosylase-associated protein family)
MSSEEVNGGGSFLSRNIGGIILAVILTVIYCVVAKELPLIRKFFGVILAIPLSFLGYVIGNKLRLLLHPDFVIASGFWGLLKERIFWRFIPQFIGAVIGLAIAFTIAGIGAGESVRKTSQLPDVNIVKEKIADDIIQSLPISPSRVKLENAPESSGNTWIGTVIYIYGDSQQEGDIVANYNSKEKTVTWWFVDHSDMKFNFNPFK